MLVQVGSSLFVTFMDDALISYWVQNIINIVLNLFDKE